MGIIFKQQGRKLQVYHKRNAKWRYLGEFDDVFHILHLMVTKPSSVGVIRDVLRRTTPHLGDFLTDLGREWKTWYKNEFLPIVHEKVL